jgi:hypothetical protein
MQRFEHYFVVKKVSDITIEKRERYRRFYMRTNYVIGADIGTVGTKTAIFDEGGPWSPMPTKSLPYIIHALAGLSRTRKIFTAR